MQTRIFHSTLLQATLLCLAVCYGFTDAAGDKCNFIRSTRPCGDIGISQDACEDIDCCWKPGHESSTSSCFMPSDAEAAASAKLLRKPCGFHGISEQQCLKLKGCQWATRQISGAPSCYRAASFGHQPSRALRFFSFFSDDDDDDESASASQTTQTAVSTGTRTSSSRASGSSTTVSTKDLETGDEKTVTEAESSARAAGTGRLSTKVTVETERTSKTPEGSKRKETTTERAEKEDISTEGGETMTTERRRTEIVGEVETTQLQKETAKKGTASDSTEETVGFELSDTVDSGSLKETQVQTQEVGRKQVDARSTSETESVKSTARSEGGVEEKETQKKDSRSEEITSTGTTREKSGASFTLESGSRSDTHKGTAEVITTDIKKETVKGQGTSTESRRTPEDGEATGDVQSRRQELKDTVEEKKETRVETDTVLAQGPEGSEEETHQTTTTETSVVDFTQEHRATEASGDLTTGPAEVIYVTEQTEGETTITEDMKGGLPTEEASTVHERLTQQPTRKAEFEEDLTLTQTEEHADDSANPEGETTAEPAEPEGETAEAAAGRKGQVITTTKVDTEGFTGRHSYGQNISRTTTTEQESVSTPSESETSTLGVRHGGSIGLDVQRSRTRVTTEDTSEGGASPSAFTRRAKNITLDVSKYFSKDKGEDDASSPPDHSFDFNRTITLEHSTEDRPVKEGLTFLIECAVLQRERCGAKDITQDECYKMDCCWAFTASITGSPSCYKKNYLYANSETPVTVVV